MRPIISVLLVALVLCSNGVTAAPAGAQSTEQIGGPDADVDCENFLSPADADAVFIAAGGLQGMDTYDLDGEGEQENFKACDSRGAIVDDPVLASCSDFKDRSHAEALFRAGGADDPYGLDLNGNDIPCDGGTAAPILTDSVPSPSAPAAAPVVAGCDVQVRVGRAYVNTDCADGTVEASFLPFEGFNSLAERARDGFGNFGGSTPPSLQQVEIRQGSMPGGGDQRGGHEPRLIESEQRTQKRVRAKKKRKRLRQAKRVEQQRRARIERLRQRHRD